ncbi:MAG TPA: PPOX class F420-dependent oxidoreductase [Herpetosiphonaceae bacterium]|nr:PPOX class F420-dependent oxidoreductase [Herpetosiphonaceae bacterium]
MDQLKPNVRAFLDEQRFAVLATLDADGSPQQSVMWYQIEEDYLMMNTARGRVKDRNLRRDPRASFCIEDGYRFVTLAGTIELIEDQEIAQADIVRLAMRYHGPEKGKAMAPDFAKQQRVTLRLTIRHVITNGFE